VPQVGTPQMKLLVPSIGSDIAELFADDAVIAESPRDHMAHRGFCRAVGFRHRVERAAAALILRPQRGAEERQKRAAGNLREFIDESGEIDSGHAGAFRTRLETERGNRIEIETDRGLSPSGEGFALSPHSRAEASKFQNESTRLNRRDPRV